MDYYQMFQQSGCNLDDTKLKLFLGDAHKNIPEEAIIKEMYTKTPLKGTGYGKCTLSLVCIPKSCNFSPMKLTLPSNQTTCLSTEYKANVKCNKDTELIHQVRF